MEAHDITVTPFGAIRFILATPDYDDGVPSLDEDDMGEIATWLAKAQAEYNAAVAERDAARSEIATYRKTLDEVSEIATKAIDERDALRAIAQAALDKGSDRELVYAPLYQQALEAIASEPQDK